MLIYALAKTTKLIIFRKQMMRIVSVLCSIHKILHILVIDIFQSRSNELLAINFISAHLNHPQTQYVTIIRYSIKYTFGHHYSLKTDWLKQPISLFIMWTTNILVKSTNNLVFLTNFIVEPILSLVHPTQSLLHLKIIWLVWPK